MLAGKLKQIYPSTTVWCLRWIRMQRNSLDCPTTSIKSPKFKPLFIPGLSKEEKKRIKFYRQKFTSQHEHKVEEIDDWTKVWPCERFFTPSLFPIPIRQGHSKNLVENEGLSPGKYTNTELMKTPNFLHLSPAHIKKHCDAIKKLTTKWPSGLKCDADIDKHYPVEVIYSNYVNSAPSIRDRRARVVTIKIPLPSLNLDKRSRLKLLRIAKSYGFSRNLAQYYTESDVLELTADRCPARNQNYSYLTYVLTVLTLEAKKHESWEDVDTGSFLDFKWEFSRQRNRLLGLLGDPSSNKIEESPAVISYKHALEKMFSTPDEELCGPWRKEPKVPKYRHNHWPPIRDIILQPVVGADDPENLREYSIAVHKLWSITPP